MKYLLLLLFLIPFTAKSYSQNDTARVEGIILDKNNVGISGVVVDALLEETKQRFTISDAEGKFTLDSLKVNQLYQFNFSHNNYKGKSIDKTTNDSTLSLDTILLDEKLSTLVGHVIVHKDDNPGDVSINISQIDTVFHPSENGDFEIISLPSGSYNIEIRHSFYDLVTRTISIAPNDTAAIDTIDLLAVMKESTIKVIIDFTNNKHGDGKKEDVKIFSDNEPLGNTNEDGILEIAIERGKHTILAELENYISDSSPFSINPGKLDSVQLSLEFKNGVIEGVIQLDTILNNSLEDVNISIEGYDELYHPDSEGHYSILNLAPGEYKVIASLSNYLSDNTTATVNKDTTSVDSIVLRLIRGRVEGKITLSDDTDGKITNTLIELINTNESSKDTITTKPDNNGYYWFDFVKDGKYKITAGLKHFKDESSDSFDIKMDIPGEDTITNNLTLEYEYGELDILVEDYYSSKNIKDARIVLSGTLNNKDTVYSDVEGKAIIDSLYQEQRVSISIKKTGFIDIDTVINIKVGANELIKKLKRIPSIIIKQDTITFDKPLVIDSISKTPESFEIEIEYLTEKLLVTAPSNFLVSKNRDNNYGNNISFDSNNGKPETIQIFVKFKPVKSDSIFEDIIVSTNYYNQESISTSIKVIGEGLEPLSIVIEKLNSEDDTVCIGSSISLRADASGGREEYTYLWKDINSNISDDSIVFESGPINANNSQISLLVTDRYNNQASKIIEINHYKVPSIELEMKGADPGILLFTKEFEYTYQWYKDSVILEGETGQYYYPGGGENGASWIPGNYNVVLTNEHQCETSSIIISKEAVKSAILEQSFFINNELFDDLLVYPNPTNETVFIYSEGLLDKKDTRIIVSNIYGKIVQEHLLKGETISSSFEISLKENKPGIYLITVSNNEKSNTSKIILK